MGPGGVENRPKTCEDTKGQEVWVGGRLGRPRTGGCGPVLGFPPPEAPVIAKSIISQQPLI